MSVDAEIIRFDDVDGVRWLEITTFEDYDDTPLQYEPSVEIEMAREGDNYERVLANFTPQDALKMAHIIRKQAKLALRAQWKRGDL